MSKDQAALPLKQATEEDIVMHTDPVMQTNGRARADAHAAMAGLQPGQCLLQACQPADLALLALQVSHTFVITGTLGA